MMKFCETIKWRKEMKLDTQFLIKQIDIKAQTLIKINSYRAHRNQGVATEDWGKD